MSNKNKTEQKNNEQDVVVFSIGKDYEYYDIEDNDDIKNFVIDTICNNKELVEKIISKK